MSALQIVSLVVSILSLFGFGTICSLFWKDRHEKKKNQTEEAKKRAKQERQEETREVMEDVVRPIISDMAVIKKGEQANLRHSLYEIYNTWMPLGYCPTDEKADFENLYQSYHNLGKNGVMDANREKLLALPETPPHKKRTPKKGA